MPKGVIDGVIATSVGHDGLILWIARLILMPTQAILWFLYHNFDILGVVTSRVNCEISNIMNSHKEVIELDINWSHLE